jgi:hypothetical protein
VPDSRGQATLELALCLPILVVFIATLVQIGVIAGDQVRVLHAAREAARVAAVDSDPAHVKAAAEAGGLSPLEVDISPEERFRVQGRPITVTVTFGASRRIPLVGRLIASRDLSGAATMRIETP